jgi:hypothetical protein
MFEKYFAEFFVSEQELKEEIHSTLASLSFLDSDTWPPELLEHANPQKPSEEFLLSLGNSIPDLPISRLNEEGFKAIELLRLSAIRLKLLLDSKELEYVASKFFYMTCSHYFLGLRYLIVVAILSEKLNKELIYNRDTIINVLTKDSFNPENIPSVLTAAEAAQEEIKRLLEDESADEYVQNVREFESAVEKYIKDNYLMILFESFIRLISEAYAKNIEIINTKIQLSEPLALGDLRELTEGSFKLARQSLSIRLGVKRGGLRERKGFSWTDDKKVAYFEAVESLPKTKGRSYWQFALDELIEHEFDAETVGWLRNNPAFKALPATVFGDAVKVWRKYLEMENWNKMKEKERPRAFEFRHALYRLGFPDIFTHSTLKSYYFAGKRMAKEPASDFKDMI